MLSSGEKLEYLKISYTDFRRAQLNKSSVYLTGIKRGLQDILGILLLRRWKQLGKENIAPVDDYLIPEILRIQSEEFQGKNEKEIIKYSKLFKEIFYIIKSQDELAGYCIYYLKPIIHSKCFKKQCVIYLIATDSKFRRKGFAKKLLKESIEEMKLNKITSILLYVNANNVPAIRLYKELGFLIIEQIENICGYKENCYKMELKLTLFAFCIVLQKTLFFMHNNLLADLTRLFY